MEPSVCALQVNQCRHPEAIKRTSCSGRQAPFYSPRWHETWYVSLAGLELATIRVLCLQACHEALRRLFLALEVQNSPCIYGMALVASLTQEMPLQSQLA